MPGVMSEMLFLLLGAKLVDGQEDDRKRRPGKVKVTFEVLLRDTEA